MYRADWGKGMEHLRARAMCKYVDRRGALRLFNDGTGTCMIPLLNPQGVCFENRVTELVKGKFSD